MGQVWAARDELLGRDVAVKALIPPTGLTADERKDLRLRVIREARAIARIDHPNVVRVFDVLHEQGEPWIVMELIQSRSLFDAVHQDGPMAPERVAEIGLAVLAGLRAAHAVDLLHRDIKPANVLLAQDGRVVLTDFGLATAAEDSSMTVTGVVLGSPSYMAPERALDQPIGPAADLWSLGATLYAAVEGRPPYSKSSPVATLAALASEPPWPPAQAGALRPALDALLQKDPAQRADAETAERLLRSALSEESAPVPVQPADADTAEQLLRTPLSDEPAPGPARASRKLLVSAAVATALIAITVSAFALRPGQAPPAEADVVAQPGASVADSAGPPSLFPPPATTTATASQSVKPAGGSRPPRPATKPPAAAPAVTKGGTPAKSTAPAVAGKRIESMATGTCLYLPAGAGAIQLSACNGSSGQRFTLGTDGTLRVLGKCVQIQNTGNGARLLAVGCTGSTFQQFEYNTSYDLVSLAAVKCVDVPDGNSASGVPAQIWECTGAGNQKWRY
jgi:serine/threonine protein kinase